MKKYFATRQDSGGGRRVRRDGGELHAAAGAALRPRRLSRPKTELYDLKPKQPHFPAKAKRVIFIYIGGGPSTIDMFDPKPALMKYDGKPAPFEIKGRALNGSQQIMASPWKFKKCGQSGRQVSELLPYFQKVVDKVTFRPVDDHGPHRPLDRAVHVRHRPRLHRLPDPRVVGRVRLGHARTRICRRSSRSDRSRHHPNPRALVGVAASDLQRHSHARERRSADLRHQASEEHVPRAAAAAARYHLGIEPDAKESVPARSGSGIAHRQLRAGGAHAGGSPRTSPTSTGERSHQEALYGIDDKISGPFGRNCLMARRLAESDVRFVTVISGTGGGNLGHATTTSRASFPDCANASTRECRDCSSIWNSAAC